MKYYGINLDAEITYLGTFHDIDDCEINHTRGFQYVIVTEEKAKEWLLSLKIFFRGQE